MESSEREESAKLRVLAQTTMVFFGIITRNYRTTLPSGFSDATKTVVINRRKHKHFMVLVFLILVLLSFVSSEDLSSKLMLHVGKLPLIVHCSMIQYVFAEFGLLKLQLNFCINKVISQFLFQYTEGNFLCASYTKPCNILFFSLCKLGLFLPR